MKSSTPSDIYADELGAAVRALVAPGAVLAAALAAMLTLTGAAQAPRMHAPPAKDCTSCLLHKVRPTT